MKKRMRSRAWHKLDNTAHLFPVIVGRDQSNVFRLTAVLSQPVQPELLQQALQQILPFFAAFRVRMRHGFFWNYLETNDATPVLRPELQSPCQYLNPNLNERYLFRMLYFENRIHLETFHVLTDGTGAMRFLKAVCCRYAQLADPRLDDGTLYALEGAANVDDCYFKLPLPTTKSGFKEPTAYKLRGPTRFAGDVGTVNLLFSLAPLKALCAEKGVTVSVYLSAVLLYGTICEMLPPAPTKRPLSLFIPVNLRNLFDFDTSLNFISGFTLSLPKGGVGLSFDEVLQQVNQQFLQKNTRETYLQKLAFTANSQQNPFVRALPLPVKHLALRLAYEHSSRGASYSLSNLGLVKVPAPFEGVFESFRFHLSPAPTEPVKCAACTYGDTVAFSVTTFLQKNTVAKGVARVLTGQGIKVTVESNGGSYETMQ